MCSKETFHKEPDELFLPLNSTRYASFYSIEMDDFAKDIPFYVQHISKNASVLELGCGTGRISKHLAPQVRRFTGIDLNLQMVKLARENAPDNTSFVCMDMLNMSFQTTFDHIIVPYNTLNLLLNSNSITTCLKQVAALLSKRGTLLCQIHLPKKSTFAGDKKLFQFQILPLQTEEGKLIKETIRSFSKQSAVLTLEERYRLRPATGKGKREDFSHVLQLAGFSYTKWRDMLLASGFTRLTFLGDYNLQPFRENSDSTLLIKASKG